MAFSKGRNKTGGRKCGSINKATFEIRQACRAYGPTMITHLMRLAENRDGQVAIKAIQLLLAYGFGKPCEQVEPTDNNAQVVFYLPYNERLTHCEIQKYTEGSEIITT